MIDLNKLEENLDNSLEKETKESLTEFINKQRDSREEGYYFVKYKRNLGEWTIARYGGTDYGFLLTGSDWYQPEELFIVGDKIDLPKD